MSKSSSMRGRRKALWIRPLALLLACAMASPLWAAPGDMTTVPAPSIGADPPKAHDIQVGDASVSSQTGALTYSYPIAVPPGRLGMQPSLALSYSSQAPIYGGIAAGWSLDVPEIRRDTSKSMLEQDYFDSTDPDSWQRERFVSTMAGGRPLIQVTEPTELAADARGAFRAQNDTSFDRYERMAAGQPYLWRVRSHSGVTHYFGHASLAPASSDKWAPLTMSVDAYGNTVEYHWSGTNLEDVLYTLNPSAGLPAFAYVDLVWVDNPTCGSTMSVGEQRDARLGISRGTRRLSQIRAVAHDPGVDAAVRHTREVTLGYDPDAASCTAQHGPINLLTTIQESAWGDTEPRIDLPAVTFQYNRLERTFDEQVVQPVTNLGFGFNDVPQEMNNLGWGIRQPGAAWPTVEAMMLDFDGDGLQDRLHMVSDPHECKFAWQRNLGRQPDGKVRFGDDSPPVQLPRLPWANNSSTHDGQTEICSLSAQLTMYANLPPPQEGSACTVATGSYLAYRWLDMNSDGLPDLVAAIHQDPHFFDPDQLTTFAWPSCGTPPSCPLLDADCASQSVSIYGSGGTSLFNPAQLSACIDAAPRVTCDKVALLRSKQNLDQGCYDGCVNDSTSSQFCHDFPAACASACQAPCTTGDTLDPGDTPAPDCALKAEYQRPAPCGQYPWMIYDNQGGALASTPRIVLQPLPLESESGDSSFGGQGVASTQSGIEDIDGDGDLDAFVLGRATLHPGATRILWWDVFLGDSTGAFKPVLGTSTPYHWFTPPSAPVGVSCTKSPGATCTPLGGAHQTTNFDVRGLSMVADLTGDGAPDLIWKHSPDQFAFPPLTGRWLSVSDGDPVDLFAGDGTRFLMNGTPTGPVGTRLNPTPSTVDYLSRSYVALATPLANTTFMITGTRWSRARLIDYDGDGRPDLLGSRVVEGAWEPSLRLQINGGGAFLATSPLSSVVEPHLAQESDAIATQFSSPTRHYGWTTNKDLADLDGDGLPEGWQFPPEPASCTLQSPCTVKYYRDLDRQPLRLLKHVDNGLGGAVDISYAATTDAATVTQHASQRKAMPHSEWVVASMTTSDRWDTTDNATTAYHYDNPVWTPDDAQRWGFRGFEQVMTTRPSGAKTVDTYGYEVDWSGRLKASKTYAAEDPANADLNPLHPGVNPPHPATISETTWGPAALFGGAITTFHDYVDDSWTCTNGQTDDQCKAADSGRIRKATAWVSVNNQLWLSNGAVTQDGPTYGAGDRHTADTSTLVSTASTYRLRPTEHWEFRSVDGVPANDVLIDHQQQTYDDGLLYLTKESQWFSASVDDRADTTYTSYDLAGSGVLLRERRPRQQPNGSEIIYSYDPTYRFVISTTNQLSQVVTAEYEPGTGAMEWSEGPNRPSSGPGCTNNLEKTWTDVDGLGRPIATWVNRSNGTAQWVKTLVSTTGYEDVLVWGAQRFVLNQQLVDDTASPARWTQEVTYLDGRGRPTLVRTHFAMGTPEAITSYDYDLRGHLTSVQVPDPSATTTWAMPVTYRYDFDSLGRPTSMRRPAITGAASGVDMSYDGLVTQSDEVAGDQAGPAGRKVLVTDHYGRLTEVREYTDLGAGPPASTTYEYDGHDLVSRVQNPDAVVTVLTHDFAGRRTRIERAGRTWTYEYDLDGNLKTEALPPPSLEAAAQYTNTYAYDDLDRMTSRTVGGRQLSDPDKTLLGIGEITLGYDACSNGVGRLCSATLPNGHLGTSYTYDPEGNPDSETRTFDFGGVTGTRTTQASYGPGGRLFEQTYADNAVGSTARTRARYTYDGRGLPSTLEWLPANPYAPSRTVASQVRNVAGQVLTRTATLAGTPGATTWRTFTSTWSYDKLSRVTSQVVSDPTVQYARQSLTYRGLDDPWTLHHVIGPDGGPTYDFTFDYDPRHQLTSVAEAAGKFGASYGFTLGGKLDHVRVTGTAQSGGEVVNRNVNYFYTSGIDPEAPSALAPVGGGANLRSYGYDTVGNLMERRVGAETVATDDFIYDGDNQLRRAKKYLVGSDGTTRTLRGIEEYYYDHAGERVAVVTRDAANVVTAVRVFIGDTELELAPSTGAVVNAYAYLSLGTPVAKVVAPEGGWQASSSATDAATLELMYQGLSSNNLVSVRPDGAVQAAFVYGPYGEVLETSGVSGGLAALRRRFNDKFRDDQTGLQYYGARYYDGLMLGWTQADPLYRFAPDAAWTAPRKASLYGFDLGNPLRYLDPDGRNPAADIENELEPVIDRAMDEAEPYVAPIGMAILDGLSALRGGRNMDEGYDQDQDSEWIDTEEGQAARAELHARLQSIQDNQAAQMAAKQSQSATSTASSTQSTAASSSGMDPHGNCEDSPNEQHGYEIYDTVKKKTVKTGISGRPLTHGGKNSARADRQVAQWNKRQPGRYVARLVKKVPSGPGARRKALKWEAKNAARLRACGQLKDIDKHKRP